MNSNKILKLQYCFFIIAFCMFIIYKFSEFKENFQTAPTYIDVEVTAEFRAGKNEFQFPDGVNKINLVEAGVYVIARPGETIDISGTEYENENIIKIIRLRNRDQNDGYDLISNDYLNIKIRDITIIGNSTISSTNPITANQDFHGFVQNGFIKSIQENEGSLTIDYENQSTDSSVYFKVYLKPGYLSTAQWSDGEIDKVEKDFKLTTTKNTNLTNIQLYNENNTITKYNDVETIVREFCKRRLQLYEERKTYQLSELDRQILLISSKCKFILEVVEETIVINKQTKEKLMFQLVDKDYPEINESYDYLLKLPIYILTKEEIDKLLKEKDNLIKQHEELSALSCKDMWLTELGIFKKEYSKFIKK